MKIQPAKLDPEFLEKQRKELLEKALLEKQARESLPKPGLIAPRLLRLMIILIERRAKNPLCRRHFDFWAGSNFAERELLAIMGLIDLGKNLSNPPSLEASTRLTLHIVGCGGLCASGVVLLAAAEGFWLLSRIESAVRK